MHAALDAAHARAGTLEFALPADRLVILSDQHKGERDGADDFQRSERAYNAALAYYHHLGHRLVLLGDVEDLWETTIEKILASYPAAFGLEKAFLDDGRYVRLWGNHDLAWKNTTLFQRKLRGAELGGVVPLEALRLVVRADGGEVAGELFLVHGHQGTADGDRYAALSALFVRYGWRRLQRLLNRPWSTPAVDWRLRGEHAETMAAWASARRRVLVAGHTHLPVFFRAAKAPSPSPLPPEDGRAETAALRRARREWERAERDRLARQPPLELATPCYFNTGCCSYGDGDITGLELADGVIRLVRWPCDPATAPEVLGEPLALATVFALAGGGASR